MQRQLRHLPRIDPPTGTVAVTAQGVTQPLTTGSQLVQGVKLQTAGDGRVQGNCSDQNQFTLEPNSNLFLASSPCDPGGGTLDLTQGTFRLTATPNTGQARVTNAQGSTGIRTPVSVAMIGDAGEASRPRTVSRAAPASPSSARTAGPSW